MRKTTIVLAVAVFTVVGGYASEPQKKQPTTASPGPTEKQSVSKDRYTPPTAEELAPMRPEYSAEFAKIDEPPEMAKKPMQARKPASSAMIKSMNVMSALGSPEKATHNQRATAINDMLELTKNKVKNIAPLGEIPALTSMYLANNEIADASPLFKLPKASSLYLDGNKLTKIDGIGTLKWLGMLSLKDNQITDISPIEPLGEVPEDRVVVLGLVSSKKPELENKDELKRRIHEASQFISNDRLALSPQCGFASTLEGNLLTQADQEAKLRLVAETAREVWG